jgi:hypothetical protein
MFVPTTSSGELDHTMQLPSPGADDPFAYAPPPRDPATLPVIVQPWIATFDARGRTLTRARHDGPPRLHDRPQ